MECVIETLLSRIGVFGPNLKEESRTLLTCHFTHRTHVEIHGFFYLREFPTWYADKWIIKFYKPGRSITLHDVRLLYARENGMRYRITKKNRDNFNKQVSKGRDNIKR